MDDELDIDDPETVMREARGRFVEAFPGRVRSITMLFNAMGAPEPAADASRTTARRMTHQMAGIAGTLGFPSVSEKASDLEQLVIASASGQVGIGTADIAAALDALLKSFAADMQKPEPEWAKAPARAAGPRVLVVEADEAQRKAVTSWLRAAGYQAIGISDGSEAFTRARIDHPALILLATDLHGTDARAVCRKLKISPDLANTPVVFMATPPAGNDQPNGGALDADHYLMKPIDQAELISHVGALLNARAASAAEPDGLLTYEALAFAAQDVLRREAAALALVRLPRGSEAAAARAVAAAARPSDLAALFDATHAIWLFPGASEATARFHVDKAAAKVPGMTAGVSASASPGSRSFESLLADADQHLINGLAKT